VTFPRIDVWVAQKCYIEWKQRFGRATTRRREPMRIGIIGTGKMNVIKVLRR
jgi:hypothetical protein